MDDAYEQGHHNYKNLRSSKGRAKKSWSGLMAPVEEGVLTRTEANMVGRNKEIINELNEKYALNTEHITYSLKKKKRWELGPELIMAMPQLTEDGEDVRLYNTQLQRGDKKPVCTNLLGSKLSHPYTRRGHANLTSIKAGLLHDERARILETNSNTASTPARPQKPQKRTKKSIRSKASREIEHIVVNVATKPVEEGEVEAHADYEVQAAGQVPKKQHFYSKPSRHERHLGGKSRAAYLKYAMCDPAEDMSAQSSFSNDEDAVSLTSEDEPAQLIVNLQDLVNRHVKGMLERRVRSSTKRPFNDYEPKNKQIFHIERTDNVDEYVTAKTYNYEAVVEQRSLKRRKGERRQPKVATEVKEPVVQKPVIERRSSIDLGIMNLSSTSSYLKNLFGKLFVEAQNVWPRHFSLNMSEALRSDKSVAYRNLSSVIWLIFQQIPEDNNIESITSEFVTKFSVTILQAGVEASLKLVYNPDTLHTVESLYTETMTLLRSLPQNWFEFEHPCRLPHSASLCTVIMHDTQKSASKSVTSEPRTLALFDNLQTIGGGRITRSMHDLKLDALDTAAETSDDDDEEEADTDYVNIDETEKRRAAIFTDKRFQCAVCFDDIDSLTECRLTVSCAHSLCSACLRDYIDTRLASNALGGKILCAVCPTELEPALIICVASNGARVDAYLKKRVERSLNDTTSKWCPTPGCNKALDMSHEANPFGTVSCTCGAVRCIKCGSDPHFPAKCSQMSAYVEGLAREFKIELRESTKTEAPKTMGTRCPNPKCHIYMEKNGGCNQMVCAMCHEAFCWQCSMLWKDHLILTNGSHNCTVSGNHAPNRVMLEFEPEKKVRHRTNQYAKCLRHRQQRTQPAAAQRRAHVRALLATIKPGDLDAKSTKREKIVDFLNEVSGLIAELHFVCEHGMVLLRDPAMTPGEREHASRLIRSLDLMTWSLSTRLQYSVGMAAVNELRKLSDKSLNILNMFKELPK